MFITLYVSLGVTLFRLFSCNEKQEKRKTKEPNFRSNISSDIFEFINDESNKYIKFNEDIGKKLD